MKKNLLYILTLFITVTTFAQAPDLINYQAIIRNDQGNLIQDSNIGMRVSILQTNATGTAVYTETHIASTNTNGLITIQIGGGSTSDDFSTIDWSSGPYFIKTETDVLGGTNYTITGTSQLLSVPYALYAKTAGSVEGGSPGGNNQTNPLNNNTNTSFAFDSRDDNTINAWSNGNSWSSVTYADTYSGAGEIISSNGNFAFNSRDDNKIFAWSYINYAWTDVSYADTYSGAGAIISSDGNFAFDSRDDNQIFAWSAINGSWSSVTYADTYSGAGTIISSEGNFAFNSRDDNKIFAWNATNGTWSSVTYTDTYSGAGAITTSNGNFIFDARDDNMIYVWNAQTGIWVSTPYTDTYSGPGTIITSPHNNGN
ncbi:hypothetical protein [Kordia sp.]|uniref:hypothetical protein n=1 Tax=Kordia sp. TaxID=1965332 RepID=UPI003D2A5247